ncbi:MAG: hypothetical protein LBF61_07665, partial [Azoarcus sp.]|nr:hypothetical protein [Azoarcus sp.]
GSSIPAVVTAFGIAADRLAAELVAWTIAAADAARRAETAKEIPARAAVRDDDRRRPAQGGRPIQGNADSSLRAKARQSMNRPDF